MQLRSSHAEVLGDQALTTTARSPGGGVASQRIADVLAERILAGSLAPGMRIKQDELATEFDASRIPVREALRILDARGLVTIRPNAGAWVTSMTLHDLELSYEIRERIEPLLLLESLPQLTASDDEAMSALHDEIEATNDVDRFLVLDRMFHWRSYSRHTAPQLAVMVERLWDTTHHYRRTYTQLTWNHGSWIIASEHRLLLDAIQNRDGVTASSVLALHIRRTRLGLASHAELFASETS